MNLLLSVVWPSCKSEEQWLKWQIVDPGQLNTNQG